MIEAPDVDRLMAGSLGEWLAQQAEVRAEAKRVSNKRLAISAVVLLPLLGLLWMLQYIGFEMKAFASMAVAIIAGGWAWNPRNVAIRQTKDGINRAIATALGVGYVHDCGVQPSFARAKAHSMFASHSRTSFEDLWSGELGGNPFTLHEAHLEEQRGSGKNRRWVTVFRGPIITIGFGRDFHGTTLVERSGRHKRFGFFGEKDELELGGVTLAKADMVHPEFEDAFTVFTTDQVEARYLVHPTYIERLIALEASFSGQNIRTLFKDGEVTVVLMAGNMFESGSLDARRDRAMVEMCVAQFMAMAGLAGALNEAPR